MKEGSHAASLHLGRCFRRVLRRLQRFGEHTLPVQRDVPYDVRAVRVDDQRERHGSLLSLIRSRGFRHRGLVEEKAAVSRPCIGEPTLAQHLQRV